MSRKMITPRYSQFGNMSNLIWSDAIREMNTLTYADMRGGKLKGVQDWNAQLKTN
jgi:hypothetical protein